MLTVKTDKLTMTCIGHTLKGIKRVADLPTFFLPTNPTENMDCSRIYFNIKIQDEPQQTYLRNFPRTIERFVAYSLKELGLDEQYIPVKHPARFYGQLVEYIYKSQQDASHDLSFKSYKTSEDCFIRINSVYGLYGRAVATPSLLRDQIPGIPVTLALPNLLKEMLFVYNVFTSGEHIPYHSLTPQPVDDIMVIPLTSNDFGILEKELPLNDLLLIDIAERVNKIFPFISNGVIFNR